MEAAENEDVVIIKEQTACFTGHREIPALQLISLRRKLKRTIVSCIKDGYRFFGAGGALGFDTLAVIRDFIPHQKKVYPSHYRKVRCSLI